MAGLGVGTRRGGLTVMKMGTSNSSAGDSKTLKKKVCGEEGRWSAALPAWGTGAMLNVTLLWGLGFFFVLGSQHQNITWCIRHRSANGPNPGYPSLYVMELVGSGPSAWVGLFLPGTGGAFPAVPSFAGLTRPQDLSVSYLI